MTLMNVQGSVSVNGRGQVFLSRVYSPQRNAPEREVPGRKVVAVFTEKKTATG